MVKKQSVIGMINNVKRLANQLQAAPTIMAIELLDAAFSDQPRPAWNTGELRSSGAAYVGGKRVAQTPKVGANPVGSYATMGERGRAGTGGGALGKFGGNIYSEFRIKYARGGTSQSDIVTTLRDTISIVFHSPVAMMMHEWTKGFSDDEAGPGYIEKKLLASGNDFRKTMKMVYKW